MTPTHGAVRRVASPKVWSIRAADVVALVVGNALLITGMWVRHGGLAEFGTTAGLVTALGQLTALYGTYLALIQLVLISRSPWLDQLFGMDRLAVAHRWLGFACVWLLLGHAVLSTVGYAMGDGMSVAAEAWTLLTTYPYILMTTVGTILMVGVAVASMREARRRFSYETWLGIHVYAYLAVALTFAHQLVDGTDFASDPVAIDYWVFLYAITIALIMAFRIGAPVLLSARHRLQVGNVVNEGAGVVSVYVTGRNLERLAVRAGQWFQVRFLLRDRWWRAHPYSISAAPNGEWLRFTIKNLGDDTRDLHNLPVGTRVYAEGPYGALTAVRRSKARVLMIAGGIGITPLRALLEEMPAAPGGIVLIYRARTWDEVVFRNELDVLARTRRVVVHYVVGRRGDPGLSDEPLGAAAMRRLVPDIRRRDVFICGPSAMMNAVDESLRALGVPSDQVHTERFTF